MDGLILLVVGILNTALKGEQSKNDTHIGGKYKILSFYLLIYISSQKYLKGSYTIDVVL
jgi:hypothetical protein